MRAKRYEPCIECNTQRAHCCKASRNREVIISITSRLLVRVRSPAKHSKFTQIRLEGFFCTPKTLPKRYQTQLLEIMLKLTPILLAIATGLVMYLVSSWRLKRQLDAQSTALAEPGLMALTAKLAKALDLPGLKVNVFEIEPVNGLAAPDGRVFITRGFLNKYKVNEITGEEIASVIAHELGHVALGHAKRRMIDFSGQNAIRVVLVMILSRFIPFVGVYIANFLAGLIGSRLSRQDEYEADAYAAALLTKAGIGTAPQINLFKKLDKMAPTTGMPAWMMSHPKSVQRIAAIEKLAANWGANKPVNITES